MKRILPLLLFALFITPLLQAQVGPYNFVVLQEDYQPLTNGTELFPNLIWDDPELTVDIPIDFDLFEFPVDSIFIGSVSTFFSSEGTYEYDETGAVIFPFLVDLLDRGEVTPDYTALSPVRHETTGDVGERIFKFEISNAGFYDEYANIDSMPSFVNVQFWLYEANNAFEYRYGPSHIFAPDLLFADYGGPIVGCLDSLNGYDYDVQTWYFLNGDPTSPEVAVVEGELDTEYDLVSLDGVPADKTVYRFYIQDVASKDIPSSELNIDLLANPVRYNLNLLINEQELLGQSAELAISNSLGQTIWSKNNVLSSSMLIPVNDLAAGNYFLTVFTESGYRTMKFNKL